MKRPSSTLLAAVIVVAVMSASGCDYLPDPASVDTTAGYVQRVKALIKAAQDKHMIVIISGNVRFWDPFNGPVAADSQAIAALDPATVDRSTQVPLTDERLARYGPNAKNGIVWFITNEEYVKKTAALIATAKEKHLIAVLDGKIIDTGALNAVDPVKIGKATIFPGDDEAVEAYGPEAKKGVLFMTTRPK